MTEQAWLGRTARCGCGEQRPSDPTLAFFEFRGEGSRDATEQCGVCMYSKVAHTPEIMARPHMRRVKPHEFVPHGAFEFDGYYCGHGGWD